MHLDVGLKVKLFHPSSETLSMMFTWLESWVWYTSEEVKLVICVKMEKPSLNRGGGLRQNLISIYNWNQNQNGFSLQEH